MQKYSDKNRNLYYYPMKNGKSQSFRICAARKIPLYPVETVGRAIGKESRIVCAITDTAFQKMIEGAMPNTDEKRG